MVALRHNLGQHAPCSAGRHPSLVASSSSLHSSATKDSQHRKPTYAAPRPLARLGHLLPQRWGRCNRSRAWRRSAGGQRRRNKRRREVGSCGRTRVGRGRPRNRRSSAGAVSCRSRWGQSMLMLVTGYEERRSGEGRGGRIGGAEKQATGVGFEWRRRRVRE